VKTTLELPDELLIAAKRAALERRWTLRRLVEVALRRELAPRPKRQRPARWITAPGGLPANLGLADRERMREWIERQG
jgi:hypothetical protein